MRSCPRARRAAAYELGAVIKARVRH
jgi:hypothetical protein